MNNKLSLFFSVSVVAFALSSLQLANSSNMSELIQQDETTLISSVAEDQGTSSSNRDVDQSVPIKTSQISAETYEWLREEGLDQRVFTEAERNPHLLKEVDDVRNRLFIKNSDKFVNILLAIAVAQNSTKAK